MPSTIFENYTIYSETMDENTYVRNNHIAAICETFSIIILRSVLPFKITTISIRTLSTEKASFRRNTALKNFPEENRKLFYFKFGVTRLFNGQEVNNCSFNETIRRSRQSQSSIPIK